MPTDPDAEARELLNLLLPGSWPRPEVVEMCAQALRAARAEGERIGELRGRAKGLREAAKFSFVKYAYPHQTEDWIRRQFVKMAEELERALEHALADENARKETG